MDHSFGITKPAGTIQLPTMKGQEVAPNVFLLEEPTPVVGTNKMRCLADVGGMLAVVELNIKFQGE